MGGLFPTDKAYHLANSAAIDFIHSQWLPCFERQYMKP